MATLIVTPLGQVTLRREILQQLGIEAGGKIELDLLPEGRLTVTAARPSGTLDGFFGLLAGKTRRVATLEDIDSCLT